MRYSPAVYGVLVVTFVVAGTAVHAETHAHRHRVTQASAAGDRPLTVTRRDHHGIYREGNDIIAPGGFSANGYGYPQATPQDRREAQNARIRRNATGPYGYGVDGIGGTGFEDNPETGYNNPYWGNAFNGYTGYGGVPTALAFGPGYANRYAAEHDPADDDDEPGPSPQQLGFSADHDDD